MTGIIRLVLGSGTKSGGVFAVLPASHLRAVQHGEVVVHVVIPERAQNKPFGLKRRAGHHALSLPPDRQGDPRTPLAGADPNGRRMASRSEASA